MSGECTEVGDKMDQCYEMTRITEMWDWGYGSCMKKNNVDRFQVCTFQHKIVSLRLNDKCVRASLFAAGCDLSR